MVGSVDIFSVIYNGTLLILLAFRKLIYLSLLTLNLHKAGDNTVSSLIIAIAPGALQSLFTKGSHSSVMQSSMTMMGDTLLFLVKY